MDLLLSDNRLIVTRVPTSRNPVYFQGSTSDHFVLASGEKFRIGETEFRFESTAEVSFSDTVDDDFFAAKLAPETKEDSVSTLKAKVRLLHEQVEKESKARRKAEQRAKDMASLLQRRDQPDGAHADAVAPSRRGEVEQAADTRQSAEEFDPYYQWLGIAPNERPVDLYRLLGLARFESNRDVIDAAADRQMGHVRRYQAGKYGKLSQALLNELAVARRVLLEQPRKEAYDRSLRDRLEQERAEADAAQASDESAEASLQGEVLGGYVIVDHLSRGSMGSVFKAEHQTMQRTVALKILTEEAAKTPLQMERFKRKVAILSHLNHRNLIAAYDAGAREGVNFLAMEFVDGQDLFTLLKQTQFMTVDEVLDFAIQAATGLEHAHAAGVTHRNIKPSKLMVNQDGTVKVIGWGRALFKDHRATDEPPARKRMVGTVDYMAPEQGFDSERVDGRADIYSLGCTIYSLLTKRLVFPGKSLQEKLVSHRDLPPPPVSQFRPDIPTPLQNALKRMLEKQPDQRYRSMAEVADALLALLDSPPTAALPPVQEPPIVLEVVPEDSTTLNLEDSVNLASFLGQLKQDDQRWKKSK